MVTDQGHGIAQYVKDLVLGLSQSSLPYEIHILLSHPSAMTDVHFQKVKRIQTDVSFLSVKELWKLTPLINEYDLYHSPSFSVIPKIDIPYLYTIHDLNHLKFGNFAQKKYYQMLLKPSARKAKAILTVSEFSKKEISQWLGVSPERLEVVYNAIHVPFKEKPSFTDHPYFLCVSNPKPHKNIKRLLKAYEIYRKESDHPWDLYLTIPALKTGAGVHFKQNLSFDALIELYQGAKGFLFPSLYEGFGRPPVEAAMMGIPLAISDIPPHHEGLQGILPEQICWVPPKETSEWAKAFHALSQGKIQPTTQDQRDEWAVKYSVEALSKSMDQIYRRVLGL